MAKRKTKDRAADKLAKMLVGAVAGATGLYAFICFVVGVIQVPIHLLGLSWREAPAALFCSLIAGLAIAAVTVWVFKD